MLVRNTWELSEMFKEAVPVERSRLPPAGAPNVFTTQVVLPAFGIGTGAPKLQPVSVQSGVALFGAGITEVGPTVQLEPVQLSPYRLVAPSGVDDSGLVELPPPMLRPPQVKLFRTVVPATSLYVCPHVPPAIPDVKSRTSPP